MGLGWLESQYKSILSQFYHYMFFCYSKTLKTFIFIIFWYISLNHNYLLIMSKKICHINLSLIINNYTKLCLNVDSFVLKKIYRQSSNESKKCSKHESNKCSEQQSPIQQGKVSNNDLNINITKRLMAQLVVTSPDYPLGCKKCSSHPTGAGGSSYLSFF